LGGSLFVRFYVFEFTCSELTFVLRPFNLWIAHSFGVPVSYLSIICQQWYLV